MLTYYYEHVKGSVLIPSQLYSFKTALGKENSFHSDNLKKPLIPSMLLLVVIIELWTVKKKEI